MVKPNKEKSVWTKWYMIVIYVSIGLIILGSVDNSPSVSDVNDIQVVDEIDNIDACYMSHQFLEGYLKAPSTAKWQNCYDASITNMGNNTYKVYSYVDSQNGFGAMIRAEYSAELLYTGNEHWKLIDYYLYD